MTVYSGVSALVMLFSCPRSAYGTCLALKRAKTHSMRLKNEIGGHHEHPYTDKSNDE